jgi:hypothetical protein
MSRPRGIYSKSHISSVILASYMLLKLFAPSWIQRISRVHTFRVYLDHPTSMLLHPLRVYKPGRATRYRVSDSSSDIDPNTHHTTNVLMQMLPCLSTDDDSYKDSPCFHTRALVSSVKCYRAFSVRGIGQLHRHSTGVRFLQFQKQDVQGAVLPG